MQLRIQSYPPLADVTTIATGNNIPFRALLEAPEGQLPADWDVELWRSIDGSSWSEQRLEPRDDSSLPFAFRRPGLTTANLHFSTELRVEKHAEFTLRFRRRGDESWIWVKRSCGLDDGRIIATELLPTVPLADEVIPFPNLASEWRIIDRDSQAIGTRLWALEMELGPSANGEAGLRNLGLGKPWGSFLRWFALVRHSSAWMGPRHGKSDVCLDRDGIMCSFQSFEGQHVVILAVTGDNHVESVLKNSNDGGIQLHARNDSTKEAKATALVGFGKSFDRALAAVMYEAREVVRQTSQTFDAEQPDDAKVQWKEMWYDGLGYCTWNAFGLDLDEERLLQSLEHLQRNDIHVTNLIIDDGWQSVNPLERQWQRFEASKEAFPNGLKSAISKLRSRFEGIEHIAVWHAIIGYWAGLSPDGEVAKEYSTTIVNCGQPYNAAMRVVDKSDVSRLYDDFYKFLVDAGIDSVKTDVQHVLDCVEDSNQRRELINSYLDAWTIASLRYFSFRTISCMSQFPQGIFHSHLRQNRTALVARNSDDYFPHEPSSHAWHLWANAHNSLFTKYLNVLPDWDMFQTKHAYGGFHAAARSVSGGPICITDVPREHDIDLIRQMTAVTVRGKTVTLRPSVVGRSLSHYIPFEEGHLLKVGAYHGPARHGSPILGIFNTTNRHVAEVIPLDIVPGTIPILNYVVRSHVSGEVSAPMSPRKPNAVFSVSLDVRGYDILTATTLTSFTGDRFSELQVGSIGLIDKMTGAAAVTYKMIQKLENNRLLITTQLKAMGVLGVWISTLDSMSIDDNFMVTIMGEPVPRHVVSISRGCDKLLAIDTERAWKKMGLNSGWGNELEVKVYFDI